MGYLVARAVLVTGAASSVQPGATIIPCEAGTTITGECAATAGHPSGGQR